MTPEIIQLAAEKGAPAQPAAKAPTASLAQAARQMQQNQQSQQAGPAPTPAQTQAPRPPFKSSPEGNADTPQGDENAQQPSSRPPFKANPQAGTDQTNPPQSIAAEVVDDYLANKANSNQTGGQAAASNPPQTGQIQIPQRFQQIAKDLGVDIVKNYEEARKMHPYSFYEKVKSDGDWDYKNHTDFDPKNGALRGKYSDKLRDDFGNWHFGAMAHGMRFNMEQSMLGAGAYQTLRQGGGSVPGLIAGAGLLATHAFGNALPDHRSEWLTKNGFSWGDNPGDAENIMEGWKFADDTF